MQRIALAEPYFIKKIRSYAAYVNDAENLLIFAETHTKKIFACSEKDIAKEKNAMEPHPLASSRRWRRFLPKKEFFV